MDAMMRLIDLSAEVEALRNKTELNRRMAKEATMQAANATQVASSLQQVSIGSAGGRFFSLCSFADAVKSLLLFFYPPESQRHGGAVHQAAGEDRVSGGRRSERHQQESHGH